MRAEKSATLSQTGFDFADKGCLETNRAIQQSITRGYDGLINGRVRPWKQAKAEADRMRTINHPSPM